MKAGSGYSMSRLIAGGILLAVLVSFIGCGGSDDGDITTPSAIMIQLDAEEVNSGQTVEATASFIYLLDGRSEEPDCLWYVNDELGGSTELGTITQENPAVYTAPLIAPVGDEVEIKAVTDDSNEWEDSATLGIISPNTVELEFSAQECEVSEQITITAELSWPGREDDHFDWYVNDELGGHSMTGTITQTNPAIYTAPSAVPAGGSVEIKAIYRGDEQIFDTGMVDVQFTIKYVNASTGVDVNGGGTWEYPFRTITYALGEANEGDVVLVAPGTYDGDLGEGDVFTIPLGVTLRGSGRDEVILYGGEDMYFTMDLWYESTVENITLGNAGVASGGELSSIGIFCGTTATIRNVKINDTFRYSAIRIGGVGAYPLVEDCEIVNTSHPGEDRGFELIDDSHAILRNCTVSGWWQGVFANTNSDPLIEGCTITDNNTGITAYSGSGEPPPVTNPDLGGGARGSLGGNVIQNNTSYGLSVRNEEGTIYAMYNTWNSNPPTEGPPEPADFYQDYETTIVWH